MCLLVKASVGDSRWRSIAPHGDTEIQTLITAVAAAAADADYSTAKSKLLQAEIRFAAVPLESAKGGSAGTIMKCAALGLPPTPTGVMGQQQQSLRTVMETWTRNEADTNPRVTLLVTRARLGKSPASIYQNAQSYFRFDSALFFHPISRTTAIIFLWYVPGWRFFSIPIMQSSS